MGRRITSVTDPAFDALFTSFEHTAYRLETLQVYDMSYEAEPYRAFLTGHPQPHDPAKDHWAAMIRDAVRAGKVFQRVHLVREPLTDYLRYELEWSYPPNVQAGEDIRILPLTPGKWPASPRALLENGHIRDYWLFDSWDLWRMMYDEDGKFVSIEQIVDDHQRVTHARDKDAALHYAIPYREYMRRREMLRAS